MAEESVLSDELLRQLIAVGEADILVGLPTFNNADTVAQVVRAVQIAFAKYFPRERTALIHLDGGSTDGTTDAVNHAVIQDYRTLLTAQPLRTLQRISVPYAGVPGRADALRILFAAGDLLRAKACAVVSPDLQSITPEWIDGLVRPILKENFDLVTPLYHRHKFDGLLINNVVYPMVRAVYGHRVREPLGGEFGFSERLMRTYLAKKVGGFSSLGIDLRITTLAMKEGYRICQSFLGAKVLSPKSEKIAVSNLLEQILGALFGAMEEDSPYWLQNKGSEPAPVFGFEYALGLEPVRVNQNKMLHVFRSGVTEFASILKPILSEETFRGIQGVARLRDEAFRYPETLWAKTLYEFTAAYHHPALHRSHLLRALTPLYLGRSGSFVLECAEAGSREVEGKIDALCLELERLKGYLIERWNAEK